MTTTYNEFLQKKRTTVKSTGFDITDVNAKLFDFQRCTELWTNPGDLVYDPFAGIGSTLYQAVLMDRRGVGCELKQSYFDQAIKNMVVADRKATAPKQVGFDYFGDD